MAAEEAYVTQKNMQKPTNAREEAQLAFLAAAGKNPTRLGTPLAAAEAGDGGHRGRAGPGRPLRQRSASGAPPPARRRRGQAQAPFIQGGADAAPARCQDPWHAGNTITRVHLLASST